MMKIWKEFTFEAAHRLPNVPPDHKCARLHGHSYRCELHVTGPVGAHSGWVTDFADITAAFEPIRRQLDHACLNDIDGLQNPTSEMLASWIWNRVVLALPGLSRVTVSETAASGCTIEIT